jgi:dihydroneopterin aldolase
MTTKLQSSYVCLHEVTFRGFHGVMPQERRVGALFTVTLRVGFDMERAMTSDSIDDTLNYAQLYDLVKREMAVPSKLLEHVAGRIVRTVEAAVPQATSIDLWLTKKNPPMGADCEGAGVELHLINDKTMG